MGTKWTTTYGRLTLHSSQLSILAVLIHLLIFAPISNCGTIKREINLPAYANVTNDANTTNTIATTTTPTTSTTANTTITASSLINITTTAKPQPTTIHLKSEPHVIDLPAIENTTTLTPRDNAIIINGSSTSPTTVNNVLQNYDDKNDETIDNAEPTLIAVTVNVTNAELNNTVIDTTIIPLIHTTTLDNDDGDGPALHKDEQNVVTTDDYHFDLDRYITNYNKTLRVPSERTSKAHNFIDGKEFLQTTQSTIINITDINDFDRIILTTPSTVFFDEKHKQYETDGEFKNLGDVPQILINQTENDPQFLHVDMDIIKDNGTDEHHSWIYYNNAEINTTRYDVASNEIKNLTDGNVTSTEKRGKYLQTAGSDVNLTIPGTADVWALASMKNIEYNKTKEGSFYNISTVKKQQPGSKLHTNDTIVSKQLADWVEVMKNDVFSNHTFGLNNESSIDHIRNAEHNTTTPIVHDTASAENQIVSLNEPVLVKSATPTPLEHVKNELNFSTAAVAENKIDTQKPNEDIGDFDYDILSKNKIKKGGIIGNATSKYSRTPATISDIEKNILPNEDELNTIKRDDIDRLNETTTIATTTPASTPTTATPTTKHQILSKPQITTEPAMDLVTTTNQPIQTTTTINEEPTTTDTPTTTLDDDNNNNHPTTMTTTDQIDAATEMTTTKLETIDKLVTQSNETTTKINSPVTVITTTAAPDNEPLTITMDGNKIIGMTTMQILHTTKKPTPVVTYEEATLSSSGGPKPIPSSEQTTIASKTIERNSINRTVSAENNTINHANPEMNTTTKAPIHRNEFKFSTTSNAETVTTTATTGIETTIPNVGIHRHYTIGHTGEIDEILEQPDDGITEPPILGEHGEIGGMTSGQTDVNAIIATAVSIVGVICLILLVGFLVVMRKRQKQLTYGQRCRPVGLDAYSLDNVSVYNSVRRKGMLRASKRSFGNAAFDDPTLKNNLLTMHGLASFVHDKQAIYEEFKELPTVTARADEVPPGCESKNRYANVVPLPETRVFLKQLNDDEQSEYINANYVKLPKDPAICYIACQAPLDSTITDFWRMIWEQNSRVIVMLTDLIENGIEKCAEYLPPSVVLENHVTFGDFTVTLKAREVKDKYAVSQIHLRNATTKTWREITHFWYQWPDTGVPNDEATIVAMLLEARSYQKMAPPDQLDENEQHSNDITETTAEKQENGSIDKTRSLQRVQGPLTVHCSPGTGRTGTVIACDIAIRAVEQPSRLVDIPQIVYCVRRGRASSVQTREQYEFIYKVAHMYATKLTGPLTEN